MWSIRICAAVLLCSSFLSAQEDYWDKIRYDSGMLQTWGDQKSWDNHLEVTSERIMFLLKDGQGLVIQPKDVTALSYGQEADRRMSARRLLAPPVALKKLVHKSREHFVGLEFTTHGEKGSLLLQGDKDNYKAILRALTKSTGLPVSVSEEDQKYVPREAKTVIVREQDETRTATNR